MTEWRLAAAKALEPLLDNFHRISGMKLRTVWRFHEHGSLARVMLDFGSISLTIEARPEDDTIELWTAEGASSTNTAVDVGQSEPWMRFVGKPFGWGWATINQQGYCDGVALSFDGVSPQMLLNVVASSIDERLVG